MKQKYAIDKKEKVTGHFPGSSQGRGEFCPPRGQALAVAFPILSPFHLPISGYPAGQNRGNTILRLVRFYFFLGVPPSLRSGVGLLRGSRSSVSPAARPPLRGALRIPHAGARHPDPLHSVQASNWYQAESNNSLKGKSFRRRQPWTGRLRQPEPYFGGRARPLPTGAF